MTSRALLLTALTFALSVACTQSEDDACGKGTVYRDGACHPAATSSAGTAGSGSIPSDAGSGGDAGAASGETIDPNFGIECTDDAECTGSTDYCVPQSPVDTRYCTVRDCDPSDDEACPASWTCTDLSRFVAGLPFACTRPTN